MQYVQYYGTEYSSNPNLAMKMLLFLLLVVVSLRSSFAFLKYSSCPNCKSSALHSISDSTVQDYTEENELVRIVPIRNSNGLKFSADNPIGTSARSLKSVEIKDEIRSMVAKQSNRLSHTLSSLSDIEHFRLHYLIKVLEERYEPILTVSFLNLVLSGKWIKMYSNVLTKKADQNIEFNIEQLISPDATSLDIPSSCGSIRDIVRYGYNEFDRTVTGTFEVKSR